MSSNIKFNLFSNKAKLEDTPGGENFQLHFATYMGIQLSEYEEYDPNIFPIDESDDEDERKRKLLRKNLEISRVIFINRFSPIMELIIMSMIGTVFEFFKEKMNCGDEVNVSDDLTDYVHDRKTRFVTSEIDKIFEDLGFRPYDFKVKFRNLMTLKFHLPKLSSGHLERTPEYDEFAKFIKLPETKKNDCLKEFNFVGSAYDNAGYLQVVHDFYFIRSELGPFYKMMRESVCSE